MEPPQKRQKLDRPLQIVPSQGTFTDAHGNDISSNFDGAGISNTGGNIHVARDLHINSIGYSQSLIAKENRKILLESLRFEQIDARHDNIKVAYAETCCWILDTDLYKKWEATGSCDVNNFLWIKGKPGAGKSTLMKFLHSHIHAQTQKENDHDSQTQEENNTDAQTPQEKDNDAQTPQENHNGILISFFFNARGLELEKSTLGLYRSLLWQLLNKNPDLQQVLDRFFLGHRWTTESLKSRLEEAIQKLGKTPIFCMIDALDECDQDQIREMVLFLEALVDAHSSLHVCFASRHYPHITVRISHEIILEERKGHKEDIATYLNSALRISPDSLAEQIRSEVQKKAQGVFMWVVLVVAILNKEYDSGRKYRLRQRLKELPGDLHLLFQDILTRDTKNRAGLLLCIQWILFAKEPLTPRQLYLAILSGTEPEFLPHCHAEPCSEADAQRYILDNSKGLAQSTSTDTTTVQFIHESVRDFLLRGNGLGELFDELGPNIRGKSHEALRNCCLTYVTMESLMKLENSSSSKAVEAFPFLDYANPGVLYHANEAGHHSISQEGFLAKFPLSEWKKQHNTLAESQVPRYTSKASLLYILAETGLPDLIRAHPGRQSCFEVEGERCVLPILAAREFKHETTLQVMLELQAERIPGFDFLDFWKRFQAMKINSGSSQSFTVQQNGRAIEQLVAYGDELCLLFFLETTEYDSWSPEVDTCAIFSALCQDGKFESARLLAKVCDFITTMQGRETPLHYAATYGAVEAAKVLVSRGADLNAKTWRQDTPLHHAAHFDLPEVAQLLISHGADISATSVDGETPLHYATRYQSLRVAQLLVNHGADVNAKAASGCTPLHSAARFLEVAQFLVDRGADVAATDNEDETPLHYATRCQSPPVAQLLVNHGANLNAKSQSGYTPLHHAVECLEMVQFLIDHGVDTSASSNDGKTLLHTAAFLGRIEVVQILFNHGVDTRAIDRSGMTALHDACRGGEFVTARLLIDCGADILAKDEGGKTPLYYASVGNDRSNRLHFASLLLDHAAGVLRFRR